MYGASVLWTYLWSNGWIVRYTDQLSPCREMLVEKLKRFDSFCRRFGGRGGGRSLRRWWCC